jgi:hypothetical protein
VASSDDGSLVELWLGSPTAMFGAGKKILHFSFLTTIKLKSHTPRERWGGGTRYKETHDKEDLKFGRHIFIHRNSDEIDRN